MIKTIKHNQEKGFALLFVFIVILSVSLIIGLGLTSIVLNNLASVQDKIKSIQSYYTAEAGIEDSLLRLKKSMQFSSPNTLNVGDGSTTIEISDLIDNSRTIISSGNIDNRIRKLTVIYTVTAEGVSFNYGVQVGNGGLVMKNDSLVSGNIYSNGPVKGFNNNLTKGDVVSAGSNGSVDGIHATGSVYSHNISNSTIDKDAYYINISNTTVGGLLYPGSPDQPIRTLPISDSTINNWKTAAAVSEITAPCPYIITTNITLGPVKITCDLEIESDAIVTLRGPVWVAGNFTTQNDAVIRLDPSLGNKSVAIIADNPSNRLTSSKIILKNTSNFQNSGTAGSYILVISQNNSSENGGSEIAIETQNDVFGDLLLYAGHGEILLKNDIIIKELSGYKIQIQNTANVIYETGLASLLFESGPGGGYSISGWREVQ